MMKVNLILIFTDIILSLQISKLKVMITFSHFPISAQLMVTFTGKILTVIVKLMLFAKMVDQFKLLSTMEKVISPNLIMN